MKYISDTLVCVRCDVEKKNTDTNFRRCSEVRRGKSYDYVKRVCRTCEHIARVKARRAQVKREGQSFRRPGGYEFHRERNLRKQYGLTLADYDGKLAEQLGCCAICQKPWQENEVHKSRPVTMRVSPLAVDHCHKTGKVRGLLCGGCNRGLGDFAESEHSLLNAILYLRKYSDG